MIRRSMLIALFAAVTLTGCSKWKTIQENDTTAIAGQTTFILFPLNLDTGTIDGDPAPKWVEAQNAEQKAAWPAEKQFIAGSFAKGLEQNMGVLKLSTPEAPDGATFVLKPFVTDLATGGNKNAAMIVGLQVIGPTGAVLEEISLKVEGGRHDEFKGRLASAAESAGELVAQYLRKRTGK